MRYKWPTLGQRPTTVCVRCRTPTRFTARPSSALAWPARNSVGALGGSLPDCVPAVFPGSVGLDTLPESAAVSCISRNRCLWYRQLAVLAMLAACAPSRDAPLHQSTPDPSAAAGPEAALMRVLPPVSELPIGVSGLSAQLGEAHALLSVRPPPEPELRVPEESEDAEHARFRRKIEAYFETGLRWQDELRLRAVELIGRLMVGIDAGRDPVLSHALSALVLEDLAALGFDASGAFAWPSFDIPPERMAEAMAHPEVVYSALSAQAYDHCETAAARHGAEGWRSFCAEGRNSMLVFAQALPACTPPSVYAPNGTEAYPAELGQPVRAGLLLHSAAGVPLLEAELQDLIAAVHAHLQSKVKLPLLPLSVVSAGGQSNGCSHPRRPSDVLLGQHPDTRWYGMFLACGEDDGCKVGVCSDADGACEHARLEGSPTELSVWREAIRRLAPTEGGLLVESSGGIVSDALQVTVEAVRLFGSFREPEAVHQALSEASRGLLACQDDHRYRGRWVLDITREGSVAATRAESDRFSYPMDQVLGADSPQRRCIEERLLALTLPRMRSRAVRPLTRRVTFEVHIPAHLQVEVPFTVRHDRQVGQLEQPGRLARDGFAVALARCAARATPELHTLGVCMDLAPDGRIHALALDPDPARRPRALRRLPALQPASQQKPPAEVTACLQSALSEFEWTCRDRDGDMGHLSMTIELPRGLVARFE